MNNKKILLGLSLVATALLAAMGCWFCWHCPSRIYPPEAHGLFWRQLAWNGVGLAVFAGTWLMGWKRLLKFAPWLMAAWLVAFAAAQFSPAIKGAHKWLRFGLVNVNVVTCFLPVFALFVAWLHDRKWLRPWMEWTAVAVTALWAVWHVAGNVCRMKRLWEFFKFFSSGLGGSYVSRQLLAAFGASNWFGGVDRSLVFLPCPESDGMMSASALLFGKWFPLSAVALFAFLGVLFAAIWKADSDTAKRRFVLLYALWLVVPAAYGFLHSLGLLPVAGFSPALAGYGGTAVVMAWFGGGVLAAMVGSSEHSSDVRAGGEAPDLGGRAGGGGALAWRWAGIWGACVLLAAAAIEVASRRELQFAEPRPSDMAFGEFGLTAKRGRILAADGSLLAYTERMWSFHLDPRASEARAGNPCRFVKEIAEGLGLDEEKVLEACQNKESRYVFLLETDDDSSANEWYERHRSLAARAGLIREPVQKRVYPLGEAAVSVVGFMHGGAHNERPKGARGLEWAFDKALAGTNGIYDKRLPQQERYRNAKPRPGADIQTTLVPWLQTAAAEALSAACATNGAESAFALVMKVPSGEIAALASWPTFDPSMRRDLDKWNSEMAMNRAAQIVFEPGGLAKPIVEAIALDSGVAADITNAVSSVGVKKFHGALRRFGFGSKTGPAGIPGEEVGILTSKPEFWEIDTTAPRSVGMGHGFAVTGLQLAQAYATLANHGTLVRPVLVQTAATNSAVQVVLPSSADAIMRMLKSPIPSTAQMCERDHATGRMVYSSTSHIASCAGFVPLDKPESEYVVVVSFTKPHPAHTGEEVAEPVFQTIANSL